jgi:adenylosuccinate lyase
MKLSRLTAISPIDGRYGDNLLKLQPIFSEFGLMYYRLFVEIRWFQALANNKQISEIPPFSTQANKLLESLITNFSLKDAKRIKAIEKTTNHDVKAIEYFIKEKLQKNQRLAKVSEFIHFACTSEDINNLAYGLMLKTALTDCIIPQINELIITLKKLAKKFAKKPMLSRTHGQPATPTTMGKELANFVARLQRQQQQLKTIKITGKCNGAVGNYNAHVFTYPNINWENFCSRFVKQLGLEWNSHTTQIESHDYIAELSHIIMRSNTILMDFCRDTWTYISLNYFKQKIAKKEVGSSTMPHKINPIDFENAEGNLGLSNTLFNHFANKLPISRLQRDLSDSTVMRNIGVSFAHTSLAYQSILKGINKLEINESIMLHDLQQHWEILAEPIQTVMRRYGIKQPYEKLKKFTRGKIIDKSSIHAFVDSLNLPSTEKQRLKQLEPKNYLGLAVLLARKMP